MSKKNVRFRIEPVVIESECWYRLIEIPVIEQVIRDPFGSSLIIGKYPSVRHAIEAMDHLREETLYFDAEGNEITEEKSELGAVVEVTPGSIMDPRLKSVINQMRELSPKYPEDK